MSSGLTDPNDPLLPEVEQRAALLRDLLRQSGWKVTAEVADGPQSVIVDEVHNGVPTRMAILARALGKAK